MPAPLSIRIIGVGAGMTSSLGKGKDRLLDTKRLTQSLNLNDETDLARIHEEGINEIIENVKNAYRKRSKFEEECIVTSEHNNTTWVIAKPMMLTWCHDPFSRGQPDVKMRTAGWR